MLECFHSDSGFGICARLLKIYRPDFSLETPKADLVNENT